MIRYPVKVSELKALISAESKTWRKRAADRTAAFDKAGEYNESSSIWSEVKAAYMHIQHDKCAYCERQLEDARFGKIEHDIEHYRPKNPVKEWPTAAIAEERDIHFDFPVGDAWSEGYYLLAYHILNYVTACKVCNTPLKSNYFPIAQGRGTQSDNPRDLRSEKPFLIYPLGRIDTDPEELIAFDGVIPVPKGRWGHKRHRAQVTIEFFELDTRETLLKERARQIVSLGMALLLLENDPTHEDFATDIIGLLTSPSSPHCNCTRSFLALYREDRPKAEALLSAAREYLVSVSDL